MYLVCERCTSCEQKALCMILIMVVTCLNFQQHSASSLYPRCVCSLSFSLTLSFFEYLIHLIIHAHTHILHGTGIVQYRFHIHAISGLVTVKFSFMILTPQLTLCLKRSAWYKPTLSWPTKTTQFHTILDIWQLHELVFTLSLQLPHLNLPKSSRNNFRETLIFLTQNNRLLRNN